MISLLVFAIAVGLRIIYIQQLRGSPLFDDPVMDELYHDQWGQAIASGKNFIDGPYFRAPLYPAFLGFVYKLFGHGYLVPRVIQAVLGSLSCTLLYWIGRDCFSRTVGAAAALLASSYWILVYFDAELLIPPLVIFLDLVLIWLLLRAQRRPQSVTFLIAGAVLGLSAIARPNILLFAPAIVLWLVLVYRRDAKHALGLIASLTVGCLTIIAPITLRNYVVGGDMVLISSQGGMNFYIGNNPQSDGRTAIVPGTPGGWWEGYYASIERAEAALGRKLKPSEVSRYYYSEGWKFIRQHPRAALNLLFLKLRLWWSRWEIPNDKGIYFSTEQFTPVMRWLPVGFGLIGPLGIVGLVLCLRRPLRLFPVWGFIVVYTASFLPFFCTARYRTAILPPLILLAVYSVHQGIVLVVRRQWRWTLVVVAALPPAVVLVHSTPETAPFRNDAFDYVRVGNADKQQGWLSSAEDAYIKALQASPYYLTARINFGALLIQQGRIDEAIGQLQTGLASPVRLRGEMGTLEARAHFHLAQAFEWRGEQDQAAQHYQAAQGRDPSSASAVAAARDKIRRAKERLDRGIAAINQELYDEALNSLRKCLADDPGNLPALNLLGHALIRTGRYAEAADTMRQMLDIDRENGSANLALLLATCPDDKVRNGQAALANARQACPRPNQCSVVALDALAAALAETGDFKEATAVAGRALEGARASLKPQEKAMAEWIEVHLSYYKSHRPFRVAPWTGPNSTPSNVSP